MKHNITIGYDRNNRIPAYVCAESIMQHSSVPVTFTFLHRDMLGDLSRPTQDQDSTEFSNNRFLTPYLNNYEGVSLFLDNDIIVQSDVKELFDMMSDEHSIMCVKHNQVCKKSTKFLNKSQYQYQYKNWTSVMLFNNAKCRMLTLDYIKNAPGLDLHQFRWIDHSLIGDLPLEWNYLVDNINQTTKKPKLIHYTEGGPYFKETQNCEYAAAWTSVYNQINDIRR